MNTAPERHAFVIGLCEVLTLRIPPRHAPTPSYKAVNIYPEHHYYDIGRGAGVAAWVPLVALIKYLIF